MLPKRGPQYDWNGVIFNDAVDFWENLALVVDEWVWSIE